MSRVQLDEWKSDQSFLGLLYGDTPSQNSAHLLSPSSDTEAFISLAFPPQLCVAYPMSRDSIHKQHHRSSKTTTVWPVSTDNLDASHAYSQSRENLTTAFTG